MLRNIMNATIACVVLVLGFGASQAQTTLMTGLKLVDRSSSKIHEWTVNSGATGNQGFLFPAAIGTAGQVVKIASVSSNDATFEWTTPAASSAGTSARLAADAQDATAWSTGPLITVAGNKKYRVVGEFMIKRGTATTDEDEFQIRLANPEATTFVACAIECLDCPTGTTGVPQYVEGTATNVDFTVIDPGGGTKYGNTVYHYRIEGIFKTGTNGGNVRLTFNKSGGNATTVMMANSYWALIEIN